MSDAGAADTPLDALRFVAEADVYASGRLAGRLVRTGALVEFRYHVDYLAAPGPPVATTLPVQADPVPGVAPGALPPFFAGLLPEGRRLAALVRAVKTSADDELSLLLAVGADAIGDVQVVPAGADPAPPVPRLRVDDWSTIRFADLRADPLTGAGVADRVGLPGVQDKVSAVMISVPVADRRSQHLLKLDPPELPHLVANEAFFLAAARHCGLPTAEAEVVTDREGEPGLLVRRFDRHPSADGVVPLAQEDGCQVLGRYPAEKYALTAEQVVAGLVGVTQAQPVAARDLFRQVAFAYLSCNGDAHAKNLSVVRDPTGEWRISPAYDLPSSHPYGDHSVALSIAGRHREDIRRADLLALAAATGLRERAASRALDELVERSAGWIARLDELPFDERRIHRLRRAVTYRRDLLVRR